MERTELRHVYDDVLYLWGDLSEENPVVRIDLMTDELTEIDANGVFDPINAARPNPIGNILFHDRGDLAFYNFDHGSGSSLPSTHELEGGGRTAVMNSNGIAWLGADSFLSVHGFYVFRVDFSQPALDVLYESENSTTGVILNLLPGMETIDIYKNVNAQGEPQPRFLVDLSDGSETTLPFTSEEEGVWLTDELYIYRRDSGGLSQVGTWIYNRSNGDNRRVCQAPMSLHIPTNGLARRSPNSAYYYEPGGRVYFLSDAGQIRGFRVDVTEGECVEVADFAGKSLPFVPFDSRYVDLGLATSGTGSPGPAIPNVHDIVLEPPAPNPARNAATIHFESSVGGPVGLAVFDLLGRRVEKRELYMAAPGRRSEVIDLSSLPSGLYFLQLQIGGREETTTMTVLR